MKQTRTSVVLRKTIVLLSSVFAVCVSIVAVDFVIKVVVRVREDDYDGTFLRASSSSLSSLSSSSSRRTVTNNNTTNNSSHSYNDDGGLTTATLKTDDDESIIKNSREKKKRFDKTTTTSSLSSISPSVVKKMRTLDEEEKGFDLDYDVKKDTDREILLFVNALYAKSSKFENMKPKQRSKEESDRTVLTMDYSNPTKYWTSEEQFAKAFRAFRDDFSMSNGDDMNGKNFKVMNTKWSDFGCVVLSRNNNKVVAHHEKEDFGDEDEILYVENLAKQFVAWEVKNVTIFDTRLRYNNNIKNNNKDVEIIIQELIRKLASFGVYASSENIKTTTIIESSSSFEDAFNEMRSCKALALLGKTVENISRLGFAAGVSRGDGRFITPFLGLARISPTTTSSSFSEANKRRSVFFHLRVHWRMFNPFLVIDDFVIADGGELELGERNRQKQTQNAAAAFCSQHWGFNFRHRWQVFQSGMNERRNSQRYAPSETMNNRISFVSSRSNRHDTARGTINMHVTINSLPANNVAIDASGNRDAMSTNAWHRLTAMYSVFVAKNYFFPSRAIESVVILLPCSSNDSNNNNEIPPGWTAFGVPKCKKLHDLRKYDEIVESANDGHLWDLAWDSTLPCENELFFKEFIGLIGTRTAILLEKTNFLPATAKDRNVCFIRRLHARVRNLQNEPEVLEFLKSYFPKNQIDALDIKTSDSLQTTRGQIQKCGIILGLHGAGMINEIYALADTKVLEIVPQNRPAYYRNVAKLRGLSYSNVVVEGNTEAKMITVDVALLRSALDKLLLL